MSDPETDETEKSTGREKRKYLLKAVSPGVFFTEPVYLEGDFILIAPEMPFTLEMIKTLEEWKYSEVYSAGVPGENYTAKDVDGNKDLSEISVLGDVEKIMKAEEFYADFVKYVEKIFTYVVLKEELDFHTVAEKIKAACEIIREDRRFLLRVQKNNPSKPNENYLASHSVKSTIISLIIGF